MLVLDGDPDGNDATDDGVVRGYLNGTIFGGSSPAGNLRAHGDDAAAMGIHQNARGSGWTSGDGYNLGGFVDELALYNTKLDDPNGDGDLSDSRVAVHYNAGSALTLGFVSADFALRRIRDVTATEIDWTTRGVLDPGDLTAVDERPEGALAGLFDTADAQGHFAPDKNIGNEGPWSVSIPLSLTADSVSLEDVVLDWQHFNNNGEFQTVDRFADWTVSVTGSVSGLLDSVTMANVGGTSGLLTLSFPTPLSLTRAETYDLKIFVDGSQRRRQQHRPRRRDALRRGGDPRTHHPADLVPAGRAGDRPGVAAAEVARFSKSTQSPAGVGRRGFSRRIRQSEPCSDFLVSAPRRPIGNRCGLRRSVANHPSFSPGPPRRFFDEKLQGVKVTSNGPAMEPHPRPQLGVIGR